jgi:hypothetical protein
MKTKEEYIVISTNFINKINNLIKQGANHQKLISFSHNLLITANYEEYIIYTFYSAISEIIPDGKKASMEDQYNRYQLYYLLWIETLGIEFNQLETFFLEESFNKRLDITNQINKVFETTIKSLEPINKPNLFDEGLKAITELFAEYIQEQKTPLSKSFKSPFGRVPIDPFGYTNVSIKKKSVPEVPKTPEVKESKSEEPTPQPEKVEEPKPKFDPNLFKTFDDFADFDKQDYW